jgi:hypothetical protein
MRSAPVAQLTEWLKLMVAEIQRKQEDEKHARAEAAARKKEVLPLPEKAAKAEA